MVTTWILISNVFLFRKGGLGFNREIYPIVWLECNGIAAMDSNALRFPRPRRVGVIDCAYGICVSFSNFTLEFPNRMYLNISNGQEVAVMLWALLDLSRSAPTTPRWRKRYFCRSQRAILCRSQLHTGMEFMCSGGRNCVFLHRHESRRRRSLAQLQITRRWPTRMQVLLNYLRREY